MRAAFSKEFWNEVGSLFRRDLTACRLLHTTVTSSGFNAHLTNQARFNTNQHVLASSKVLPYHKIEHFEGNPQGPSFSFASGCAASVFCFGAEVWVFGAVPLALFSAFPTAASFVATTPFAAPSLEPFSQKLTLLMAVPKLSPWMVASSSSVEVGWRDPSAPEKVPAPQGLPPRTSLTFAKIGKVVLYPKGT